MWSLSTLFIDAVARIVYAVPGRSPDREHFRTGAVARTLHVGDSPTTVAAKDVIGDPVAGFGNVTAIPVVDSAMARTPESA